MNSKKTNCFISILNIIAIAIFVVLFLLRGEMDTSLVTGLGSSKLVYSNFFIDLIRNNLTMVSVIFCSFVGLFNFICGMQNTDKKSLSATYIIFGLLSIVVGFKDIFGLLLSNGNVLNIIFYVIYGVMVLLVLLQLIAIKKQEKGIVQSTRRKIVNFITYILLYFVFIAAFGFAICYSFISLKINNSASKDIIGKACESIKDMQSAENATLYIPVLKEGKYGFVDGAGNEKIPCNYEQVSFFVTGKINEKDYCFALVKDADKYSLITKGEGKADVSDSANLKSLVDFFLKDKPKKEEDDTEDEDYKKVNAYTNALIKWFNMAGFEVTKDGASGSIEKREKNGTYSDGSVDYKNEDGTLKGWTAPDGKVVEISSDYEIIDVLENIAILVDRDGNSNIEYYVIVNKDGKRILRADYVAIYDNFYLIRINGKTSMYDLNFHELTNGYDKMFA